MTKYNNIYDIDEWREDVINLKAQGYSTRQIAREVFDKESYRNRLNDFFKREDVAEEIYHRACQLEDQITQDIVNSLTGNSYENWKVKPKPDIETDNEPKILYYDLECSPTKAYIWRRFKENISQDQVLDESYLLTQSWAWNDGDIDGTALTGVESLEENDEVLVTQAWHLFDNASIIVGHNLRRFDVKKVNARFAYYGFPAPSPYKIIDTLEICKAKFSFPSNKLNDVCKYLGIGVKADTGGFNTWKESCAGSDEALQHMLKYNHQDIHLTRELYKRLRGFDNNAVNLAVMKDNCGSLCPTCGSDNVSEVEGKFAYTPNSKYQVYKCGDCKTNMRTTSHSGNRNKFVRVV